MKPQIFLVAFMLLATVPAAQAQASPFMEDASGDPKAYVGGTPTDPPAGRAGPIDLQALYVAEVTGGFQVAVQVASLSVEPATFLDSVQYRVYTHYGGVDYAIHIGAYYPLVGTTPSYWAEVGEVVQENGYEYLSYRANMPVVADAAEATLTVVAPRQAFTDTLGAPVGVGSTLKDFYVTATGTQIRIGLQGGDAPTYIVSDRMPDDGVAGIFPVTMGVKQEGDARLTSDAPFRLSNGGATSMVYQVAATNLGERQTFMLRMESVPQDWDVQFPFDRVTLDDGQTKTFPILLTTPSGHNHGGTESFLLTMTGQQDKADIGRLELGVTYPEVPQPAGHHPQLWIHAYNPYGDNLGALGPALGGPFGESTQGYMNALEEDPADLGQPIPAWGNNIAGLNGWFEWWVPLVPDLGMGLDFDTGKQATLSIPVNYDYIAQDVVLRGELRLWSDDHDKGLTVGTIQPSLPLSWGPGVQTFDVVMDIDQAADFIPYTPNAYLYLELNLQGVFLGPGPFGPGSQAQIMPGASMVLPLNEYRDEVQAFYQAVESLRFDAEFLERPVNPGKTVIFETHLRNVESEAQTVQLNLSGANKEWARLLGATTFELGAGKERTVAVAVVVPADATDGGIADLVVTASNKDDPFKAAVIDLIAIVDTETTHPDEAHKIGSLEALGATDKKSPGFEIAAVALGLLAIALVLRRRA